MHIAHIKIKNFRSIQNLDIDFSEFSILVGQNNHGKTNFFDAIDWFDSAKKTDNTDKNNIAQEIEIEITYIGAQQWLSEMQNEKNQESIYKLIGDSDTVTIRKTTVDHKRYFIVGGEVLKNPTWFDSALNDFLPKIEYVRTKARLSDVNQYKSTTPMGQMLWGVLTAIIENEPKYKIFKETFDELFEWESSTARQQLNLIWKSVESFLEKQFPDGTKVKFSIESPIIDDLLKNFETEIDDWVNTSASMKGDGMQRALMLAIIQAFAKFRRENGIWKSFTFLLDEAELHLHPSAQRALKNALNDIVQWWDQVFVNTHSSVLIIDELPRQAIYKVEKGNKITTIKSVSQNEKSYVVFELLWWSPSDLLLPRNFLIVEWASEWRFIQTMIQKYYPEYQGIHVISAGGDFIQQERTMNGINQVFCPLATWDNPIYKWKVVILCDKTHATNEADFDKFTKAYKLVTNEDIFTLPTWSIEEYYPSQWTKSIDEIKVLDIERKKVSYAKEVADAISKEAFETHMSVVFMALDKVNARSF